MEDLQANQARSLILEELSEMGFEYVKPVEAGKQNYVFTYKFEGKTRIAKVADSRHRSLKNLQNQVDMLLKLKAYSDEVCAPICMENRQFISALSIEKISFYIIVYTFAEGVSANINHPHHVELMAKSLARLHVDMQRLPIYSFPKIVEVQSKPTFTQVFQNIKGTEAIFDAAIKHLNSVDNQLLHGDFNSGNIKIHSRSVKIFDFDNCAYGTTFYELANVLYMVLFNDVTQGKFKTYQMFKRTFLDSYQRASEKSVEIKTLQNLMSYRVILLASWLIQPNDAPLFIRQSSQQWLDTLNNFVGIYFREIAFSN